MEDELCHGHDLIHILEFWQDTSTLVLENNQLATDVMIMVRQ